MTKGLDKDTGKGGGGGVDEAFPKPNSKKGANNGPVVKQASLYDRVVDLVENIDELSDRAHNMKMTRSEYMNCLRQVTKVKVLSIKEAKTIFQKRINKLLKA